MIRKIIWTLVVLCLLVIAGSKIWNKVSVSWSGTSKPNHEKVEHLSPIWAMTGMKPGSLTPQEEEILAGERDGEITLTPNKVYPFVLRKGNGYNTQQQARSPMFRLQSGTCWEWQSLASPAVIIIYGYSVGSQKPTAAVKLSLTTTSAEVKPSEARAWVPVGTDTKSPEWKEVPFTHTLIAETFGQGCQRIQVVRSPESVVSEIPFAITTKSMGEME